MLATILGGVITALVIAGILAWLRSHWLYLVVPRLYLHTPLSSGQVVSLTLMNRGLVAEEDVAIRLKNTCKYELIAASKSTLSFQQNTIALPRLARFESVDVLLLVEGKAFDKNDVEGIESKLAAGKIVEKKDQVVPLWQHFVLWPVMILIFGLPFIEGTMFGRDWGYSAIDRLGAQLGSFGPSKQLAGYKIETREGDFPYDTGPAVRALKDGKIRPSVKEVVRHGDILELELSIANTSGQTVVADASVKSSAAQRSPLEWRDGRLDDLYVGPGDTKGGMVRTFLAETSNP